MEIRGSVKSFGTSLVMQLESSQNRIKSQLFASNIHVSNMSSVGQGVCSPVISTLHNKDNDGVRKVTLG